MNVLAACDDHELMTIRWGCADCMPGDPSDNGAPIITKKLDEDSLRGIKISSWKPKVGSRDFD